MTTSVSEVASSCGEFSEETELEDDVISARLQILGRADPWVSELVELELDIVLCPREGFPTMVGERRTRPPLEGVRWPLGGGVTLLAEPRGDRAVSELWSELLPSL